MIESAQESLLRSVEELRAIFPEMRFGQLIANLATAAGCTEIGEIWDVEDEQLLKAARRLIERNGARIATEVESPAISSMSL